jgi:hypothetical protein
MTTRGGHSHPRRNDGSGAERLWHPRDGAGTERSRRAVANRDYRPCRVGPLPSGLADVGGVITRVGYGAPSAARRAGRRAADRRLRVTGIWARSVSSSDLGGSRRSCRDGSRPESVRDDSRPDTRERAGSTDPERSGSDIPETTPAPNVRGELSRIAITASAASGRYSTGSRAERADYGALLTERPTVRKARSAFRTRAEWGAPSPDLSP